MTDDNTSVTDDGSEIDTSGQRLTFSIPSPSTKLVLGTQHWDGIGYDGFSAITDGNVLLGGYGTSSAVTIESVSQIQITSSNSTMSLASKDDLLVYSQDKAYFCAKNWVMITSGAEGPQHRGIGYFDKAGPADTVPTDEVIDQVKKVKKHIDKSVDVAGTFGTALAVLGFIGGMARDMASLVQFIAGFTLKALSATLTPNWKGTVHVYGADSVTVSSAGNASLVALDTAWICGAQFATIFGGVSVSLMSPLASSMSGGYSATIMGFYSANVMSLKGVYIAARFGDVNVMGTAINIGKVLSPSPQMPTMAINIEAVTGIHLEAGPFMAPTQLDVNGAGMTVTGALHHIVGKLGASLNSGTFGIHVDPTGSSMQGTVTPEALTALVQTAKVQAQIAKDAAIAQVQSIIYNSGEIMVPAVAVAASAAYQTAVTAAKAILETAQKVAKNMVGGVMRMAVGPMFVQMNGGLASKVSIDAIGNVTIDGGGMIVTIKTGAASIMLTPTGVIKMGPIVMNG